MSQESTTFVFIVYFCYSWIISYYWIKLKTILETTKIIGIKLLNYWIKLETNLESKIIVAKTLVANLDTNLETIL